MCYYISLYNGLFLIICNAKLVNTWLWPWKDSFSVFWFSCAVFSAFFMFALFKSGIWIERKSSDIGLSFTKNRQANSDHTIQIKQLLMYCSLFKDKNKMYIKQQKLNFKCQSL